jgi:hypothetical protein
MKEEITMRMTGRMMCLAVLAAGTVAASSNAFAGESLRSLANTYLAKAREMTNKGFNTAQANSNHFAGNDRIKSVVSRFTDSTGDKSAGDVFAQSVSSSSSTGVLSKPRRLATKALGKGIPKLVQ